MGVDGLDDLIEYDEPYKVCPRCGLTVLPDTKHIPGENHPKMCRQVDIVDQIPQNMSGIKNLKRGKS